MNKPEKIRPTLPGMILIIAYGCLGLCACSYILPLIEQEICVQRVADRIGVAPDYGAIREYVTNSLLPGMTRSEVEAQLSSMGILNISRASTSFSRSEVDIVEVQMCLFAQNNIKLFAHYDYNGKLISTSFIYYDE